MLENVLVQRQVALHRCIGKRGLPDGDYTPTCISHGAARRLHQGRRRDGEEDNVCTRRERRGNERERERERGGAADLIRLSAISSDVGKERKKAYLPLPDATA